MPMSPQPGQTGRGASVVSFRLFKLEFNHFSLQHKVTIFVSQQTSQKPCTRTDTQKLVNKKVNIVRVVILPQ